MKESWKNWKKKMIHEKLFFFPLKWNKTSHVFFRFKLLVSHMGKKMFHTWKNWQIKKESAQFHIWKKKNPEKKMLMIFFFLLGFTHGKEIRSASHISVIFPWNYLFFWREKKDTWIKLFTRRMTTFLTIFFLKDFHPPKKKNLLKWTINSKFFTSSRVTNTGEKNSLRQREIHFLTCSSGLP